MINSRWVKTSSRHPTDKVLHTLSLGKLKTAESKRVQRHLFACGSCLQRSIKFEMLLAIAEVMGSGRLSAQRSNPRQKLGFALAGGEATR